MRAIFGQHWKWALVVLGVVGVVTFGLWRAGFLSRLSTSSEPATAEWIQPETRRSIDSAKRIFRTLDMVDVSRGLSVRDRANELQSVAALELDVDHPPNAIPSEAIVLSLFTTLAEFEDARYSGKPSADYIAWRKSRGYRWLTEEEMALWSPKDDHEPIFGTPLDPAESHDSVFGRYFDFGTEGKGGSSRPVKFANETKGVLACFGVCTSVHDMRPYLRGELGDEVWHGRIAATMRKWWAPGVTERDLIARHGSVLRAQIGIVSQMADGRLGPRIYSFYWDPDRSQWWLSIICDNNSDITNATALEY